MTQRTPPHHQAPPAGPAPRSPGMRGEIVLLIAGVGVLVWVTGSVLLLIFAGVLLAVALDGLARPLVRHARLPRGLALALVLLAIFLLAFFGARTIAPQFMEQFGQLWDQLGGFVSQAQETLQDYPWVPGVNEEGADLGGILGSVATATFTVLGAAASLLLVLVIGLFAAADPRLYQGGLVKLVPLPYRDRAKQTLAQLGYALRWWLLGQLVSMLVLGVTTALGLLVIGVDLWLGLGVLVALLTFVPFLGPIIAGIPVVLIGFTHGVEIGIAALVFYLILQNLEGNILTPMIQQRAISLPPAMLIAMQVLLGTLFGIAGLILAAPLAVVTMVAVNLLYVEDVLGDRPQPKELPQAAEGSGSLLT